ncbi:MAG: O-antigen ligase family protein [Saprospiraceae bacterium]
MNNVIGLTNRHILSYCIAFTAIACIFLLNKIDFIFFLPLVLGIAFIYFLKPDTIWTSIAFFTPLSINPNDVDLGDLSVAFPTEPLLILLVFFFFYISLNKTTFDKNVLLHPFSILIYIYFIWLGITSLTSTHKIVSFKFLLAKIWFIVPCYFLGIQYFKDENKIIQFLKYFTIGISIVAAFNFIHLSFYGFGDKPSQWTMKPFFKDHTILGAILGIAIPISLGTFRLAKSTLSKYFFFICFIVQLACLIVTFSRAAWASIIAALLVYIILQLKIKFKYLIGILVFVLIYIMMNITTIMMNLEKNKVSSSDDVVENVESMSNISTDASNLERINRWASAVEMWREKPIFGFGPGTYMFEYAPYQLSYNLTEISTNFGDVGNAHSEYLGPLAETGMLGMLLFIAILFLSFHCGFHAYYSTKNRTKRILISTSICALSTYYLHGLLNNFLDTDKAAVIFWTLTAILIYFHIEVKKSKAKI